MESPSSIIPENDAADSFDIAASRISNYDHGDAFPCCPHCGKCVEAGWEQVGGCTCEATDDVSIEWDWEVTVNERTGGRDVEDAFPFCPRCGKCYEVGWGQIGACSCEWEEGYVEWHL
jgi:bacterioferritin-associated ferredoxin